MNDHHEEHAAEIARLTRERDEARAERDFFDAENQKAMNSLSEALAVLRDLQYRPPNPLCVPECVVCGATGPINEKLRKRPAERCAPGCRLAALLAAPRPARGHR